MKAKLLLSMTAIVAPTPVFAQSSRHDTTVTHAVLQVDRSGHVNAARYVKIGQDDDGGGVAECESECASEADFTRLQDCANRDWASGRGDTCEQRGDNQEQDCRTACYENTQTPVYTNPPYPDGKGPGAADGRS